MVNKLRWQAPGNAKMFDDSIEHGYKTSKMVQRSIGVLKFILNNNNNITVDKYKKLINSYLCKHYEHKINNSTLKHFYRPLQFVGFIRENEESVLSLSIDGKNFLSNLKKGNYEEAEKSYILQMLKTKYPNKATKSITLKLFPFRILFKLLL